MENKETLFLQLCDMCAAWAVQAGWKAEGDIFEYHEIVEYPFPSRRCPMYEKRRGACRGQLVSPEPCNCDLREEMEREHPTVLIDGMPPVWMLQGGGPN